MGPLIKCINTHGRHFSYALLSIDWLLLSIKIFSQGDDSHFLIFTQGK